DDEGHLDMNRTQKMKKIKILLQNLSNFIDDNNNEINEYIESEFEVDCDFNVVGFWEKVFKKEIRFN
ncbi:MAG: hypothetical protein V1779_15880, partial [bacterium]